MKKNKTSDHLANERTFLAWLRTSVALMGFGFILVKFSVFLKQISLLNAEKHIIHSQKEYSDLTGLILVATGVVILILSYLNYRKTQKKITENIFVGNNSLILTVTVLIVCISIFLIAYFFNNL
ncbi:putative membrane protein [Chryseobacterium taeanense]|uniref:Putative membrane protein n=1 Tax=Chryseobacterium taeanense TaxID=311334 RepID=A0A1G8FJV4_9FLAO|nr:DUF202 domain-containing protein [Chryseobacterium taeanense]SDH82385.1 putative membrane protein [Chryseobacterium taeanense]